MLLKISLQCNFKVHSDIKYGLKVLLKHFNSVNHKIKHYLQQANIENLFHIQQGNEIRNVKKNPER